MKVSIIVCTYNRHDLLRECLDSLKEQTAPSAEYEVLIIDNNSSDRTGETTLSFCQKNPGFYYHFEAEQGLSHARNRGLREAAADWVGFIDDDARAPSTFVERALWIIDHYSFDAFGGNARNWFRYGKPKWLPDNYESMETVSDKKEVAPLEQAFLIGGNMFFRKETLLKLGGFPVDLGMSGRRIAYGEETLVQEKLRQQGYAIGYDPELTIDHLFGKHKFRLTWHIRAHYARGRDAFGFFYDRYGFFQLAKDWLWILFITFPKSMFRLMFEKRYYWQNAVLDVLRPAAFYWGKYRGGRKGGTSTAGIK